MNKFKNIEEKKISEMFSRNPEGTYEKLSDKSVGIAGAGGLGSNVAEILMRSGIGRLVVCDHDVIELNNLGRQNYTLNQIGMLKVDALRDNLGMINPNLKLETYSVKLNESNISTVFTGVDILIEALDEKEEKEMLIKGFSRYFPNTPVIIASGLGGYGKNEEIRTERVGTNLWIIGDQESRTDNGLIASRVTMVAAVQANFAVELLVDGIDEEFGGFRRSFTIVGGG